MIGCTCAVCRSPDPHNHRLRPSVLVRVANRHFLIDAGPDFRQQALRYGIQALDGLLFTHAHYDHTAGLDDLRPLYYRRDSPLPILLSADTARELLVRYAYLFEQKADVPDRFDLRLFPFEAGSIVFEGVSVGYVTYRQGGMPVNGFRIGQLAYISDIRSFTPSLFTQLEGVKDLIISALRYTSSPMHLSVDEAIDVGKAIQAERVWLMHISHELDHEQTNAYLPSHVRLAYDGLELEFE